MKKCIFTHYSAYDEAVIRKASSLNMPLIGGTALEVLGDHYNTPCYRLRSDNDLDFLTNRNESQAEFTDWVRQHTDATQVQVDIMLINSHQIPQKLILDVYGIKVMSPEYLIWSKLQRFSVRDQSDIKWLLNLTSADKLEDCLEQLGVTKLEIERINQIIIEVGCSI